MVSGRDAGHLCGSSRLTTYQYQYQYDTDHLGARQQVHE